MTLRPGGEHSGPSTGPRVDARSRRRRRTFGAANIVMGLRLLSAVVLVVIRVVREERPWQAGLLV